MLIKFSNHSRFLKARYFAAILLMVVACGQSETPVVKDLPTIEVPSSEKAITAFSFTTPAATGIINETNKTIAVSVPFGTNISALIATFTTTGTNVKVGAVQQVSTSSANNFSTPVIYSITAQDASTVNYTVTVTIASSNAKDFTGFTLAGQAGVIASNTIAITVPFGTNVTALAASFTTTGASVNISGTAQASAVTANDFTSPRTYTVVAADASTKNYIVTVTVTAAATTKDFTAFSILGQPGTIGTNTITVTVPFGTNATNLIASFVTNGVSVNISGLSQISTTTANDFSGSKIYTVIAEDSTTKNYTVTVTVAANPAKDLTSFTILGQTGTIGTNTVAVTVPFGTNVTALVSSFATTGASVNISGVTQTSGVSANNFSSAKTYAVVAADASTKTYTVTVTVSPNPAKDITAFSILGQTGTIGTNTVDVTVPFGTNLTALIATFTISGASVNISGLSQTSGGTANNFTSAKTYTIVAADSSTKNYTVTVSVALNPAKNFTAFSIQGITGVIGTSTVDVTLPFGTNATALTPTFTISGASVNISGISQTSGASGNNFTSSLTYTVVAADASTKDYTTSVCIAGIPIGGAGNTCPLTLGAIVTTPFGPAQGTSTLGDIDDIGNAARFATPSGITSDGSNLYVADTGKHKIRKIVIATGVVTTIAGPAQGSGLTGDADGTGNAARFNSPYGITTDGTNLYVSDYNNHKIRKIVISTSVVTTLAGPAPGSTASGDTDATGNAARFKNPYGITTDGTNLYVADSNNHKIRKIVIATGVVTNLAGPASAVCTFGCPATDTDGTGDTARFDLPYGITTDGTNLYVADYDNNKIRQVVITTGVVTTLAGPTQGLQTTGDANGTGATARFWQPTGITTDGTNLYVTDLSYSKIRKIVISSRVVTTIAGPAPGATGFSDTDGVGNTTRFMNPRAITTDGTNLFVADTLNNKIRRIK